MADNDVQGPFEILLGHFESDTWKEVWAEVNFSVHSFETLGLARNSSDAALWRVCQQRQIILVTGNRNDIGPESLESTIRQHNTADSLPVFTLADPGRVSTSKQYANRVAEKLLEYFLVIDTVRGTGRLFVPGFDPLL